MSKEVLKLALEALESERDIYRENAVEDGAPEYIYEAITALCEALAEHPAQQEPVAFLANGTRFKISYDNRQSGGQIHGIPPELGGRWVAFVAADDDCHLKLTSPPAQRKPLKPIVDEGLTAEQRLLFKYGWKSAEAAHNIKENT